MRNLFLFAPVAALLALTACGNTGLAPTVSVAPGAVSGALTVNLPAPAPASTASKFKQYACLIDNFLHPVVQTGLEASGVPGVALANDNVIHPLIAAYCASQNGTAVALSGQLGATATPTAPAPAAPAPATK